MKPSLSLLLIAFLFQSFSSFAQTTGKALLQFQGHSLTLGVSKNEKLFIGTDEGEMAFADSIKGFWHRSWFSKDRSIKEKLIARACYFNADTAFVCGRMETKNSGDIIFRTVNGGKDWTPVKTGRIGRVDDAAFQDNGEAWLSIEGKGLVYTTDFGSTWSSFSFPIKNERFARMYFNNKREGIIGSEQNIIAYTKDNCHTWIPLPTPLDQKKYNKTAFANDPTIYRVAIFNDYLLVAQERLVFYSKVDSINWVFMPGYEDFYTDADNSALFFQTHKDSFVKVDSHLQPVCSFETQRYPHAAICRNGSLFICGQEKMWQIDTGNKLIEASISTNKDVKIEPAPHPVFSRSISNGMLDSFCANSIKKVIFSRGEYGDGSRDLDSMVYIQEGEQFVLAYKSNPGTRRHSYLASNAVQVDQAVVAAFAKKIPAIYKKRLTIDDLAFTCEEYDSVKCNIITFKTFLENHPSRGRIAVPGCEFAYNVNNLNFDRLLALVDTIKTIDSETLNEYFLWWASIWEEKGYWPTYRTVTLINTKDEVLEIRSLYDQPHFFYLPWLIRFKGTSSISSAIEINDFLKAVFPQFLYFSNRIEFIQELVKELYRASE